MKRQQLQWSWREGITVPLMTLMMLAAVPATADIPYEPTPYWESGDTEVSTGVALADVDQDGWPDLVVANGNDIHRQHLVIYYNQGYGVFPDTPDWQSSDIDYHAHLAVGDVNGDGYPDVAVSVYLGPDGFGDPGRVKLYLNDGSGTLGDSPAWSTPYAHYTIRCAFGDPDLDGDLDLAVACGEFYNNIQQANLIFRNDGGTLEETPFWSSDEIDKSHDVSWDDVDLDGDLDLAVCNTGEPNRVYYNRGGNLSTTADWSSTDSSMFANTLAWGDVNGDGYPDLAVADNNQLGGSGRFKIYLNNGSGILGSSPAWSSDEFGFGSSVVFSDMDDDGDLDLATGQWWGPVRIYLNTEGSFPTLASWASNTNSVIERICFGDVDKDNAKTVTETFDGSAGRTLFVLSRRPVEKLSEVRVGSQVLSPEDYCVHLENGWISLADDPAGATVTVSHTYSLDQDMAVSNWDSSRGNYIFRNIGDPDVEPLILVGPGPGFDNPPLVRVFPPEMNAEPIFEFSAYGAPHYGANVTCGDVNGNVLDEILTGPGPGDIYGPHVRGFQVDGTPLPGLSFLAYGTNKWGVNVAAGNIDDDELDEIITGAGPGAVFGPHVRGFNYDGTSGITPVPGVSYFAYGTPKWGVNVAAGDIDGDGYDEIVTGAGPGAVYGPHVRGWNVDGGPATAISEVSFLAYGTNKFGVNVTCGDLDGDGMAELVTGAGPGAVFGAHVRGWNFDGTALTELPGINFFAWLPEEVRHGAKVFAGTDLDGDGEDELVVGCGPDPNAGTPVKVYDYDGMQVTEWFSLEAFPGLARGTSVAAGKFYID